MSKNKPRGFEPQPLELTLNKRRKLIRDYTAIAVVASTQSWANHSCYIAVDAKGQKRTHRRGRTKPEVRRIRRHRAHLAQVTLRSLTCAYQGKSSSAKWEGLR